MPITTTQRDITGSITQVVVASIDPTGPKKGSVFLALQAVTQGRLGVASDQLRDDPDGHTVLFPVQGLSFQAVALVVDRQELPLQALLEKAFHTVDLAGWKSLSVAAVRLGSLADVGSSSEEKLDAYCRAARIALAGSRTLDHIQFVFYGDIASETRLREKLQDPRLCTRFPDASISVTRPVPDFQDEIACISGDGQRLATPTWTPGPARISVTRLESGEVLSQFDLGQWGDPSRVDALALDEAGQRLLVAIRFSPRITMYEVAEGRLVRVYEAPQHAQVGANRTKAVAFSRDGSLISTGFGRWVGVWETESGRLVGDFPLPQPLKESLDYNEGPSDIRFSQDNSLVYVGTGDGHSCTLDLKSQVVLTATDHESHEVVEIRPSGQGLSWSTRDGRVWGADAQSLHETEVQSQAGARKAGRFVATQADDHITLQEGEKILWTRAFERARVWSVLDDGTVLLRIARNERPVESLLIVQPDQGAVRRIWPWDYSVCKAVHCNRIHFGRLGNRVEEYSLLDGSFLRAYTGEGRRATVRRHPWFPEIVAHHGDGHVDLNSVIHGGRRFYDFQKTNQDGSMILVQTTRGVAILNADFEILGEVHFHSVPLVGYFKSDQAWVFTSSGHLYRWQLPENARA